jgi:hypothetical protein
VTSSTCSLPAPNFQFSMTASRTYTSTSRWMVSLLSCLIFSPSPFHRNGSRISSLLIAFGSCGTVLPHQRPHSSSARGQSRVATRPTSDEPRRGWCPQTSPCRASTFTMALHLSRTPLVHLRWPCPRKLMTSNNFTDRHLEGPTSMILVKRALE